MSQFEDPLFGATQDSSLWTAYTYAQQPAPDYAPDPPFASEIGADREESRVGHDLAASTRARRASHGLFGSYGEGRDGLGFDSYLDPAILVQPPPSSGYLHPPSPGVPALSSADSTPSSSSALPTPYGPFDASPPSAGGLLLPSAPIGETNPDSRFAKLQESYLERREEHDDLSIVEPSSHALTFSTSAPLTPRRPAPSATQLWRSPSSQSVNSSPSKSPYAYRAKPYDRPLDSSPTKPFDSPSRSVNRRNFATSDLEDGFNTSPTKGGRRPRTNLSIDVPSKYGLRSRLPVIAASPQVPQTDGGFAGPGLDEALQMMGGPEVELDESTLQQVENLLQEFGPMARSGVFDGGSSSQSSSSLPSSQGPSSSASNDTRYCISGVSLSLEDMAQLDDPSLTAAFDSVTMQQYPASAPPYQTTFNLPEPPSPSPYHLSVPGSLRTTPQPTSSPSYVHDSYSSQPVFERWSPSSYVASRAPPYGSHTRSISAPRSAYHPTESELASFPLQPPVSHSLAQTYSTHSLPSHSSPPEPPMIRRRSSIASGSPSSWSHAPPRPQQTFHSYSYGPPPESPTSSALQQSPYHSIPLPLRPAPPPGTHVDVSPPASPTKPKSGPKPPSTSSSPTKPPPASPKKKRAGGPRTRNPSAMFVNFSAADAKKLLSGVAPSGSSKKKREEEEAAAAAAAAAQAGPSGSAQFEPTHPLHSTAHTL
ncbi:hypothetical protein JCM11491_003650 [Sporobolomyces phaffii]